MIWNECLAGLHAKITPVIYISHVRFLATAELHCASVDFTKHLRAEHMKDEFMSLFAITESEYSRRRLQTMTWCFKMGLTINAASHAHKLGQWHLLLILKYVWVKSGHVKLKNVSLPLCFLHMFSSNIDYQSVIIDDSNWATYLVYVHDNRIVDL